MLKIGWSRKDVSTDKPVIIPGQYYIRFSKGVLDPIMVTALTVDDGNDYAIFLQADLVNANAGVFDTIKEKVSAIDSSIDTKRIIMNVTHTHAGPLVNKGTVAGGWGEFSEIPHDGIELMPPDEYFEFFTDKAAETICESFKSRNDGYISYGFGYAVTSQNRRAVYFKDMTEGSNDPGLKFVEGTTRMYGRTDIPEFSHLESGADHYANFMFTFGADKKLTGAVVNIPCPSQNMELEYYLSSDYWADVRAELTARYGDIYVLPQCAAAGDLAPRPRYYGKAEERRFRLKYSDLKIEKHLVNPSEVYRRRDICEQICNAFEDVYSWAKKELFCDVPVMHTVRELQLDKRRITEEEYAYYSSLPQYKPKDFVCTDNKVEDLKQNSNELAHRHDKNIVVERYLKQDEEPTFPMEMHVVRIGNIAFATNQFELYMDFAHRIQGRSPFEQTFIVQLCAQPGRRSGTYLATERATKGRGYSANLFSNHVSPKGGQQLVEATLEELNKLHDK